MQPWRQLVDQLLGLQVWPVPPQHLCRWYPAICDRTELEGPHDSNLLPLWQSLAFFYRVPPLCHANPLRDPPSGKSTPVLSLGPDLQSLSLNTQPILTTVGTQTSISDWDVYAGTHLCAEFSPLCILCICC